MSSHKSVYQYNILNQINSFDINYSSVYLILNKINGAC